MEFGEKLRQLRTAAGLTQEALGERADIPTGTVRNLEQCNRQPSWPTVVKLARALGVSIDQEFATCEIHERETEQPKQKPKK